VLPSRLRDSPIRNFEKIDLNLVMIASEAFSIPAAVRQKVLGSKQ